jgi:outer membrane immunogenic protein
MKISFIAAAFATLTGAPAFAADMPIKSHAPIAFNWGGYYVGAQIGAAHVRDGQRLSSPTFTMANETADTATGFIGGVHAGYNWQASRLVYGVEADFEGGSTRVNHVLPTTIFPAGTVSNARLNWQGSVRGRIGYAVDRTLFYGTAGWAYASFKDSYNLPGTVFNQTVTSPRNGWTAGLGIEYAVLANLTMRAEYRYTDFGSHTDSLTVFLLPPGVSANKDTENAFRIGASYKFGQ